MNNRKKQNLEDEDQLLNSCSQNFQINFQDFNLSSESGQLNIQGNSQTIDLESRAKLVNVSNFNHGFSQQNSSRTIQQKSASFVLHKFTDSDQQSKKGLSQQIDLNQSESNQQKFERVIFQSDQNQNQNDNSIINGLIGDNFNEQELDQKIIIFDDQQNQNQLRNLHNNYDFQKDDNDQTISSITNRSIYQIDDKQNKKDMKQISQNQLLEKFKECIGQKQDYELALTHLKNCFQQTKDLLVSKQLDKDMVLIYSVICFRSLCLQAQLLCQQGQYNESLSIYLKCINVFEVRDPQILGKIYQEIANIHYNLQHLQQSVNYFIKALVVYEKLDWKIDIADVLVQLAEVYALLSSFVDAKKLCDEALSIYRQRLQSNHQKIAETYHTLGYIFMMQKQYKMAIECLKQSIDLKHSLYGERNITMARTYNLLGVCHHYRDQIKNSIESYEHGVWIYQGQPVIGLALILNNLGVAYSSQGKNKCANLCLTRAAEILEKNSKLGHPSLDKIIKNKKQINKATKKNDN